jgi:lipopolysaccharide/colanic/teichoic acid biosynthesis glycosyltransferase
MLDLSPLDVDYKIAPPESISIIGSNSIHTAGDLYVVNINAITKSSNKRRKRLFDFSLALVYLVLGPFIIWVFRKRSGFTSNSLQVLSGKKSWVGYIQEPLTYEMLPPLKTGILNPGDLFAEISLDTKKKKQLNMLYAKDYSVITDIEIVLKNWKNLDRQ